MKVLELTNNPQVDTHALKECIENDPALTTRVLRVVNSSLFGLSREVSDLNHALALLGSKPLKLLVLGFSLPGGLFSGVAAATLGWYWRRTLTKAVAAREISQTVWRQPGDEAFIAALLQDLGMLLLIQELGAAYVGFLEKVRSRGGDLLALESEAMGFNHTALTARLLDGWGFPEALVHAVQVGEHARPADSLAPAQQRLLEILSLAELVARLLTDGHSQVLSQLVSIGREEHGLSSAQLHQLVDTLEHKVGQLADVLSLQLPHGLDYRDVLAQAHAQMAEVAADAAEDLIRYERSQSHAPRDLRILPEEVQQLSAAVAQLRCGPAEPAVAEAAESAEAARAQAAGGSKAAVDEAPARAARATASGAAEADPGLIAQLAAAVTTCRQSRCPLSLLLVELGQTEDLLVAIGPEGFDELVWFLRTACRELDHGCAICVPFGDAGFAVILPDCERHSAVRLGNSLIQRVRRAFFYRQPGRHPGPCLGVGAATVSLPPKNFPPGDLFDAARRCLYGSHASGGAVVKSIEIY
jgi:HD-like signal output (HDOD) protein/GGDEF domain-containing protein